MDNKIKMLRNGSMPKNEWRNLLCNVLQELLKVSVQEADSLSFSQAIDKVLGKGVSVRHTSWAKGFKIVPYLNHKGYAFWDGTYHTPDVPMTASMLYIGWEVIAGTEQPSRFNLTLQEALEQVVKMKKVQHESFDELSYLSIYDGNYVIRFINKHPLHQYHFIINPSMLQGWRVLDK